MSTFPPRATLRLKREELLDNAIKELLERYDDEGFEVPGNNWQSHPYKELEASVLKVQAEIEARLGLKLKRDGQVQDASLHDQLFEQRKSSEASNTYFQAFCVRFSNFGRLFTIGGVYPELLVEFPVDDVRSIAEEHGWNFVPAEALDEPYDGANRQLREEGISWWDRYFDYL